MGSPLGYIMIPDLPEEISDEGMLKFYDQLSGNYSDQLAIHVHWWTHRQNPSMCVICDTNTLIIKVLNLAGKYITKSTVDMETYSSSENDSDSEIENENDLNHDEEAVPEYDTISDSETPEE